MRWALAFTRGLVAARLCLFPRAPLPHVKSSCFGDCLLHRCFPFPWESICVQKSTSPSEVAALSFFVLLYFHGVSRHGC